VRARVCVCVCGLSAQPHRHTLIHMCTQGHTTHTWKAVTLQHLRHNPLGGDSGQRRGGRALPNVHVAAHKGDGQVPAIHGAREVKGLWGHRATRGMFFGAAGAAGAAT
jgi:hypothetical protein